MKPFPAFDLRNRPFDNKGKPSAFRMFQGASYAHVTVSPNILTVTVPILQISGEHLITPEGLVFKCSNHQMLHSYKLMELS